MSAPTTVSAAIAARYSARAYLGTPVSRELVTSILERAVRAPSGGNLQPWIIDVVMGKALDRLKKLIAERRQEHPLGEGSEYPVYPPKLHEPYRTRRFECGEALYAAIDIPREDRAARFAQLARNFDLFGAPVGLFFSIDRRMGPDQWADVGMLMQNIALLAIEEGLDTCMQEAWAVWPKTLGEFLGIPDAHMLFCGMALGYADRDAAINSWRTERAPLNDVVTFHA